MSGDRPKIVVADDDATTRRLLAAVFGADGIDVVLAEDGTEAVAAVVHEKPSAVLLDLRMPGMGGLEALGKIRELAPEVPVLILTSHGEVATAVEAIRLGAYDFLQRPIDNDVLVITVRRALERRQLVEKVKSLEKQLGGGAALALLAAPSDTMKHVVEQVRTVAPSGFTVLVQGETGTGKELVARAIHQESGRRGTFVALDCGAIPENLLESELFGHEKGAFSGADRRRDGHLVAAEGGSFFLDEVGNLPAATQAKLLRVLQEKQVTLLGGTRPRALDVRFIAATNEPLGETAARGFREDLYYRLAEFTIKLPPLRARGDDVLFLADRFADEAQMELRRPLQGLADDARAALRAHGWPGNVRELRNVVRQLVLQAAPGSLLRAADVRALLGKGAAGRGAKTTAAPAATRGRSLKEISAAATATAEGEAIRDALRRTGGNKAEAARLLEVDYKTLYTKMKRYGLPPGGGEKER
jgi:DNA-binding NtrC family response regulator